MKAKPERSAPRRVTSEAEKFLEKEILKRNSRNEPLGISRQRILLFQRGPILHKIKEFGKRRGSTKGEGRSARGAKL